MGTGPPVRPMSTSSCPAPKSNMTLVLFPLKVDDLDGTGHYRTLGVEAKATAAEIKKVQLLHATILQPGVRLFGG